MTGLRFVGDLPVWLGLTLGLVAAALAWRYYRRETAGLSRGLRWGLPALRSASFFLGILLLTGPVLHRVETVGELGRVRVVVDGSESMALTDAHVPPSRKLEIAAALGWLPADAADRTPPVEADEEVADEEVAAALDLFDAAPRWRRAERALTDSPAGVLDELRRRHEVTVSTLRGGRAEPREVPGDDGRPTFPADPGDFAPFTDLSAGLADDRGTVAADGDGGSADRPQSAVVLLTDGRHNRGPSPLERARALGERGTPVFAVSVGASEPAADLAVVGVEHPDLVFAKDRLRGTILLRDAVPAGTPFVAEVRAGDAVLWREELVTANAGRRRIDFDLAAEDAIAAVGPAVGPGGADDGVERHVVPLPLTAAVVPLAVETETRNNARPFRPAAISEGNRVLLLDGRPRWETRYLRNLFARDDRWTVNTVLAGPTTDDADLPRGSGEGQFPDTRDGLFEYDLIVFGEIPPALFTAAEWGWLREFVGRRGGGLIFVDGSRGTLGELTPATLLDLLPVERTGVAVDAPPSSLRLTDAGAAETALRLQPDAAANRRFWTELPPPKTLVPTRALPGATVLVEAEVKGRTLPAMVTRPFGAGRVLYLAFDETWRWRYRAADTWHQRAWNQLARFAMPRPFAVSDEYVSIDAGPVAKAAGDAVPLRVRLRRPDGTPATGGLVDAVLMRDGTPAATVRLTDDPAVPGLFRGTSAPLDAGEYEVSVRASGYGGGALAARASFVVLPPESGEAADTSADETLLADLAAASGGAFLKEEEIDRLPDLLAPLSGGRVVESDVPLWQSYWWFAAMIGLLTAEWLLRKRAGLM